MPLLQPHLGVCIASCNQLALGPGLLGLGCRCVTRATCGQHLEIASCQLSCISLLALSQHLCTQPRPLHMLFQLNLCVLTSPRLWHLTISLTALSSQTVQTLSYTRATALTTTITFFMPQPCNTHAPRSSAARSRAPRSSPARPPYPALPYPTLTRQISPPWRPALPGTQPRGA